MANSGPKEKLPKWNAELVAIYISAGHDYWGREQEGHGRHGIQEVSQVKCVAGMGICGDRYFGHKPDYKGQVTFFDAHVVDEIRVQFQLPQLAASVFRRNLMVRGVDLGQWANRRFLFQGIEFEGSQECKPCHWMDRAVCAGTRAFMQAAFRGGLRARVLTDGLLKVSR